MCRRMYRLKYYIRKTNHVQCIADMIDIIPGCNIKNFPPCFLSRPTYIKISLKLHYKIVLKKIIKRSRYKLYIDVLAKKLLSTHKQVIWLYSTLRKDRIPYFVGMMNSKVLRLSAVTSHINVKLY